MRMVETRTDAHFTRETCYLTIEVRGTWLISDAQHLERHQLTGACLHRPKDIAESTRPDVRFHAELGVRYATDQVIGCCDTASGALGGSIGAARGGG